MLQKQNELTRYLKIVFYYKYLFVTMSLLVMTVITIYSYNLPKKYKADSTVFIEKNIINKLVEGIAMTSDLDDQIRVLNVALISRDIVTKVLVDINSDIFTRNKSEQQAFISELRRRINISVSRGRDLFTVSLVDSDPLFAQNFVNTLVSKYVEESVSAKRDESYGANRFLVEQLGMFKKKLDRAESEIITFRKKRGIYLSLDEQADLTEIKEFLREKEDIELELQTLEARQESLVTQLDSLDPTVDIFSETGGGGRIVELERRLGQLLFRYTENYPEVIRLKAEIEGMKRQKTESEFEDSIDKTKMTSFNPLYQEVQQNIFDVESEISSIVAKRKNLIERISLREKNLQDVPEAKKEMAILIQERDSYRDIYQELLTRMGQSEVTKQMEISDKASTFRVVDPATYPEVPVSPDMVKMILLAIVGGLGCGFGVIVLFDVLNSSVNDPTQLEEMGVDVLAIIPNISDGVIDVRKRRTDLILYVAGGLYFSCFIVLLLSEVLHIDMMKSIEKALS